MKFFRRKKKQTPTIPESFVVPPFEYHPKIILAWAKGIEGNQDLLNYLWENDFKELVIASHAIHLKDDARKWLMENGFPHFMAFIRAAEGDTVALSWLKVHGFDLFYNMALAMEGNNEGFKWINVNSTQEIFMLTRIIKAVKDEIEHDHNETHKRSRK